MRIYKYLYSVIVALMTSVVAFAQGGTNSAVSMHSENYDLYGEGTSFNIVVGSNIAGTIEVDCGSGRLTYDVEPAYVNGSSVTGTIIQCDLSATGNVDIYTPQGLYLDYLDLSGCGLTSLNIANMDKISVLNVEHNSLTALDLTDAVNAIALYLGDNPFDRKTPLIVGPKPDLMILEMNVIDYVDPSFTLRDYPTLVAFDAMSSPWMTECDPSECPQLMKLSIDASYVSHLDVSKNPELTILNISETAISEIDLSNNPKLTQLYCTHASAKYNTDVKIKELDLSHNPELIYLFCSFNDLTSLDLSKNTKLLDLYVRNNYLTEIDLSNNPNLNNVMISRNYFNFNTLPEYRDTWLQYEYAQRPIPVSKAYKVGTPLDLSAQVVNPESPTYATLYYISDDNPAESVEVEPELYDYADGVLTINSVIPDSVYCYFYNEKFPAAEMRTSMFKVKSEAQYGQPYMTLKMAAPGFTSTSNVDLYVGVSEASEQSPKPFYVDFGDGKLVEFTAYSSTLPAQPNVSQAKGAYGDIKVYVSETDDLTAFGFADEYLSSIDLTKAKQLNELSLVNTELYGIDLRYNCRLQRLILQGNHFTRGISLEGANGYYSKNVLSYIDLRNNELTGITLSPVESIHTLNLAGNKLSSINLTDGDKIVSLDLSNNEFEYLKINYLSSLLDLNVSHNHLNEIVLPETNVIQHMDITYNDFTLANMPDRNGMNEDEYIYAPQHPISIPDKAPACDLSSQDVVIDGHSTQFTWYTIDNELLAQNEDYTIENGLTQFMPAAMGKKVYCQVDNAAYPAFAGTHALRTTEMEVMGLPDKPIGEFTATADVDSVRLSLASLVPDNTIFIDWGDGTLVQYPLAVDYTVFEASVKADSHVKIYAYDEDSNLSVFSITGVPMRDADFSKMRQLICLSLDGAELTEVKLPEAQGLTELSLSGSYFTDFDFSQYPALQFVNFNGNKFEAADLSGLSQLQNISFSGNGLKSIKFSGNDSLWGLYLDNNELTDIDLTSLKQLYQVTLNHNKLSEINLDGLDQLKVLYLDFNNFTFATLPLPRDEWALYVYYNQAPIDVEVVDGVVDLSAQAQVNGQPTTYTWYEEVPVWNSDMGAFEGPTLTEGVDYTIEDGITTFNGEFDEVICLMTNPVFPNAYMYTDLLSVVAGVSDIETDGSVRVHSRNSRIMAESRPGVNVAVYSLDGTLVARGYTDITGKYCSNSLAKGVYIVKAGDTVKKLRMY